MNFAADLYLVASRHRRVLVTLAGRGLGQGRRLVLLAGVQFRRSGGQKSPVTSRGKVPVGSLRESPQWLKRM